MKRYSFLIAILLILGIASIAVADNIPSAVDPKSHPVVWTANVYNGSGDTIVSGYIVRWDFTESEGFENWYDDMCPWVETVDGTDSVWTAGVVPYGKNIANGDTGAIIIRGPAYVLEDATTDPTENQTVGSTDVGRASSFAGSQNTTSLGICILDVPANITGNDSPDNGNMWCIVFVDPTTAGDD